MNTDPTDPVAQSSGGATIVAPLTHFGLIGFSGADARSYLHKQLTSDVDHLAAEQAQYSAWCSPQGRMLASFLLFRREADYLALLSNELVEFIEQRLRIYVLRAQVKIADRSADHRIIGLSGPRAAAVLRDAGLDAPATVMTTAAEGSVIRLDETRYLVVAGAEAAPRIWRRLSAGAVPADAAAWQWLDVAAGIPWICAATREAFVPQMVSFERIGGLSFSKGCYPGQEIVARARYLGKVKRHLYRTRADEPLQAGMPIFSGTPEPCGQIANAAAAPGGGYDALAVILEDAAGQGGLRAALAEGGIALADPVPVGE